MFIAGGGVEGDGDFAIAYEPSSSLRAKYESVLTAKQLAALEREMADTLYYVAFFFEMSLESGGQTLVENLLAIKALVTIEAEAFLARAATKR